MSVLVEELLWMRGFVSVVLVVLQNDGGGLGLQHRRSERRVR